MFPLFGGTWKCLYSASIWQTLPKKIFLNFVSVPVLQFRIVLSLQYRPRARDYWPIQTGLWAWVFWGFAGISHCLGEMVWCTTILHIKHLFLLRSHMFFFFFTRLHLEVGHLGRLLAVAERPQGHYSSTLASLELLARLMKVMLRCWCCLIWVCLTVLCGSAQSDECV